MIGWMAQTFTATTLLMLLVLAIRGPVANAFGPRAAYVLWALPALRLLLPSLPGWLAFHMPALHVAARNSVALIDPVGIARLSAGPSVPLAPLPPSPPLPPGVLPVHVAALPWAALLVVLWLGGAAVWFGWQMLRYRGFLTAAMRSARLLSRECGVDVLITRHVDGPVAAGIVRRRIFLPADFMKRYGPAERRLALLHEGAHHDRRDILANLVALLVLALHWWNPLAHRAYRAFRADQELACDATVLADMDAADRHAYGSAVLKSVSSRMPGVACALSHKAEIKRRLQTMARRPVGWARSWAGGAVAVAAIGAGLLATASGDASVPATGAIPSPADLARIRADGDQARQDGLRAAAEGRHAAAKTRREAAIARAEGRRAAAEARDAARDRRTKAGYGHAEAAAAIDASRQEMAARCAREGKPVPSSADWRTLALCGETVDTMIAVRERVLVERDRALAQAERARDHAERQRDAALDAAQRIRDQAQARQDAAQARRDVEQARRDAAREAADMIDR